MKIKLILLTLISGMLMIGCTYDVEDTCDTSNVTYKTTITGLLTSYECYTCHAGTAPLGNINLEGYANVKAQVTAGRLFGAINHSPGFSPMPDGRPKMNDCDISKFKAWIDAGAPDN
ncbi:MAG TPA: hypothetical protein VHK91_01725 [Flavisolibacter sp.]|jgi:hypothetical protein|nr:hypothetical protein [Flavisolibacter sp.]